MTNTRISRRHWVSALGLALGTHLIAIYFAPDLIMRRVIKTVASEVAQPYWPPPIDHTQRRIVMPSPDLLYAVCAYDLTEGPLRVQLPATYARYWSIALYNSRSDNFLTVSGEDLKDQTLDLLIDEPRSTRRGLLLLRVLTGGEPDWLAEAEQFRRHLTCHSVVETAAVS